MEGAEDRPGSPGASSSSPSAPSRLPPAFDPNTNPDAAWEWYQSHIDAYRDSCREAVHDLRILLRDLYEKAGELEHVHTDDENKIQSYDPERDHPLCATCALIVRVEKEIDALEAE